MFNSEKWTEADAVKWLKEHNFKNKMIYKTENFLWFRQVSPKKLKTDGYDVYHNKKLGDSGVELVIAYKEQEKGGKVSAEQVNKFINESYKDSASENVGDYVLDKELSNKEVKIYHDPKTNKTVAVNRGTKEASDWLNNAAYAVSNKLYKKTGRYKRAQEAQDKAIKKYGKVDSNIGHSQGAIITRNLNEEGKTGEVINVNPASKGEAAKDNEYNVRSKNDVVSALQVPADYIRGVLYPSTKRKRKQKDITIEAKTNNPLTEHSSDILNRIEPDKMIGQGRHKQTIKNKLEDFTQALHMENSDIQDNQKLLHESYENMTKDELKKVLFQREEDLKKSNEEKTKLINALENEGPVSKRHYMTKDIELYDIINFHKFNKTQDGKILEQHPEYYEYNPFQTSFDKNIKKNKNYYRDYQKKFIEDWSVSAQELVILYYGVGSGKTMIAVNCAEQFQEINQNAHIYFLTPASLVLGTIKECYDRGIQANRKDANGDYIYYFVSYQQLLKSNFDFKSNSLLIIDEAHNLRNLISSEISEKVSARKYKRTGNYSLVGNKLSEKLIESSSEFLRTIFMTGTLFVNSSKDIETLMSIGYKKQPLLNIDYTKYESMINSDIEFKIYYEGLISYYRVPKVSTMPSKNFEFVPIQDPELEFDVMVESKKGNLMKEPYFMISRNQAIKQKVEYIIEFLNNHKNEKTLIYSQFLGKSINPLLKALDKEGIKYGFISGQLTQGEKMDVVKQYNDNEIKLIIFTLSIKEGISFKETNNIIIFQPYWNYAIMEQIMARGIRLNSHEKQNKAIINIYFLVAVQNEKETKDWFKTANQIMNFDIKNFVFIKTKDKEGIETKELGPIANNYHSRDIDLYNRMFIKQEEINIFEERLLGLPRFEDVNNNENNDFIKEFNLELEKIAQEKGHAPNIKESIKLKKSMYKEFYNKKIKDIDSRIVRFNQDTRYKSNRNPNLEEKASENKYGDKTNDIKKLINKKASLSEFLTLFNISKQDITQFQANFTPISEIDIVIDKSGIASDTRKNLKILEPTAGIGNFIEQLLKLDNRFNFMIDCNEFNNAFYQIGKNMYDEIDNVKWYNGDFWIYNNKYNYDYILGNPPFNLAHQVLQKITYKARKGQPEPEPTYEKVDKRLYDIHFVSKAYNLLNNGGILSMIISDRFLRQKDIGEFSIFNLYLNDMKKIDNTSVDIIETSQFKEDKKNVSKEMTTNFGMVCITLKKIKDFNIDLESKKRVGNIVNDLEPEEKKELIKNLGLKNKRKKVVNLDKI
jgi:superfamily II DNA or RNA helicase